MSITNIRGNKGHPFHPNVNTARTLIGQRFWIPLQCLLSAAGEGSRFQNHRIRKQSPVPELQPLLCSNTHIHMYVSFI